MSMSVRTRQGPQIEVGDFPPNFQHFSLSDKITIDGILSKIKSIPSNFDYPLVFGAISVR